MGENNRVLVKEMKVLADQTYDPDVDMDQDKTTLDRRLMDAGMRSFRYNTAQKAALRQLVVHQRDRALQLARIYDEMLTCASLIEAER